MVNTLIIGDLHEPFSREGYLKFTKQVQKRYNCKRVVFIGDLIDNHYPSFHTTDPDGLGGGMELDKAIERLQTWYKAYPEAYVTEGNHDAIIKRKAFEAGVPKKWIKDYADIFETPNWEYGEQFEFDNVMYTHGTGSSGDQAAFKRALYNRKSVVQGHLHSFASIQYTASESDRIFGMQVGCGVDQKAYSFAYAKTFPRKFIVSCAVVLEKGKVAFPILMDI
jgi:metallophosphoesterase superfamily enzyme